MTRIKFCGMTRAADVALAAEIGADYAGVVLAPGARHLDPERAREVLNAGQGFRRVGVFRHVAVAEILRDAETAGLDVIQLHGRFRTDEIDQLRERFDGELWAVVAIDAENPAVPEELASYADISDAIVLDTSVGGHSGGTGIAFDWRAIAPALSDAAPGTTIVLAGGLNPANVADAIRALAPAVVDVSSGVESSPGIKDPIRMRAFAEMVRSASIV